MFYFSGIPGKLTLWTVEGASLSCINIAKVYMMASQLPMVAMLIRVEHVYKCSKIVQQASQLRHVATRAGRRRLFCVSFIYKVFQL